MTRLIAKVLIVSVLAASFAAANTYSDAAGSRIEPEAHLPEMEFTNIDGGYHNTADWAGHPILVINSASMCGFTPQYQQMQALHDTYEAQGLIVLAVPSDDFRQELDTAEEVQNFCEITYGITLPMTDITHVRGPEAHPFYQWMQSEHGWAPRWNFNKVLIGGDGAVLGIWGARTRPDAPEIVRMIEQELLRIEALGP